MTDKNVCLHWQAFGLPFDSDMRGAVADALSLLADTHQQHTSPLTALIDEMADGRCWRLIWLAQGNIDDGYKKITV